MLLDGTSALVTGAESGIGRAVAEAYAVQGARVVLSDVDDAAGADAAARIRDAGGVAGYVHADVGSADQCRELVESVVRMHGQLDIACNNAGIAPPATRSATYRMTCGAGS